MASPAQLPLKYPLVGTAEQDARRHAKRGLTAAREVLASVAAEPPPPGKVGNRYSADQIARARRGIARARATLEAGTTEQQRLAS